MKITENTLRRLIKKVISEIYTSSDYVSDRPEFFRSSGKDQSGVTYSKVHDMLKQWYRSYDLFGAGSFGGTNNRTYDFFGEVDTLEAESDLFDNVVSLISGNIQRTDAIEHACSEAISYMTAMGPHSRMDDKDLEKCALMLCIGIVESFMPVDFNYNTDRSLGRNKSFGKNKSIEDTIKFGDDLKNIADVYISKNEDRYDDGVNLHKKDKIERERAEIDRLEDERFSSKNRDYLRSLK